MKYTTPEVEFLEIGSIDVIQTSAAGDGDGGLDENEFPLN